MDIQFTKFQGTGNDFILIDNRKSFFKKDTGLISSLCNRNFGIGSDGIIFLENGTGYDFKMDFFNPDGSHAEMCGNGARCITSFAKEIGIKKHEYIFLAGDGAHRSRIISVDGQKSIVRVTMKDPRLLEEGANYIDLNTGTPHHVLMMDEQYSLRTLEEIAIAIKKDKKFNKEGINIDFVWKCEDHIKVKTFERGVNGFTLSCGTGVTASALAANKKGIIGQPVKVSTDGGNLMVGFERSGNEFNNIWLEGPAEKVFKGTIKVDG